MKKIQILHAVGAMNRGGIETWLMHVLRHIDRDRFQMDFLVQTDRPSHFDDEARALGARIIPCTKPARFFSYCRKLRAILREYGPYDVVHSHISFSGVILRAAYQNNVPIRIVHSHNAEQGLVSKGRLARRLFLAATKRWIKKYATHGFACSETSAVARFGQHWKGDPRWSVLLYSVDIEPFRDNVDSCAIRAEIGLPTDAIVVGHVGRFHPQKNHRLLIRVANEVVRREPRIRFVLVGDGELLPDIERQVDQLGLRNHVYFLGVRSDVPKLMLGAMDVFMLPSHYEGLGLVAIEAQLAGLPCILSDRIPAEADQVPALIRRVSLSATIAKWSESVISIACEPRRVDAIAAQAILEQTPYNIRRGIQFLEDCYASQLASVLDCHPLTSV